MPFRIVIVGAGAIARNEHVPAAIASEAVELVGLVDPNSKQAQDVCDMYGVTPEIAPDIASLRQSFDGAIVATPNHLHAPVALQLIEMGIPVLIEKPIATELALAEQVADAAEKNQVTVHVGYQLRHDLAGQTLKRVLDHNEFGRPLRFAIQHGSRGGWSPVSGYNLDLNKAGGGVLVTSGTHFLDQLLWLWGKPTQVAMRDNGHSGPESHCIAYLDYGEAYGGLNGTMIFSRLVALAETTTIEVEDGFLMLSGASDHLVFRPKKTNGDFDYLIRSRGAMGDSRSMYQRQLEDFAYCCRTGNKPAFAVDARAGAESVALLERLYASRQRLTSDPYGYDHGLAKDA